MNLYVGLKLKTINNDFAEIIEIDEQKIIILYHRKKVIISKRTFYRYNIQEFIECEQKDNTNKIEKKVSHDKPFIESCKNCMEWKKGDCMGCSEICSDYRPSPEISKEEMDRWPKEGDASYYRTHKFARVRV